MDWTQKNILVVGCGISGIGATELLEKMGACPILYDENEKVEKETRIENKKNDNFNNNYIDRKNGRKGYTVRSMISPTNSSYSSHNKDKRKQQMESAKNNY